jgi:hypothetical protein
MKFKKEWIFDMNQETLFSQWVRLGVNFPAFDSCDDEPFLEELISQTSIVGRYEPRLLECMAGWIAKHGDLINTALMHRHLSQGNPAVLGLVFDLIDSRPAAKLKKLLQYCSPNKKPEMLFHAAENSPTMKAEAIEKETAINKKWNLLFVSLRTKTDAVFDRKYVLKHNPNLARRALFGPGMRTEILNFLLSRGKAYPAEIAKHFGYRYHRVFEELKELVLEGAVMETHETKKRILRLSPAFENYLRITPW